jgi:hypothetical protein
VTTNWIVDAVAKTKAVLDLEAEASGGCLLKAWDIIVPAGTLPPVIVNN